MDENLIIQLRLDSQNKGAFYIQDINEELARMEVEIRGDKLIVYHTEVSEQLRGMNCGRKLMDEMVAYARQHELKVMPFCPFVLAQFKRRRDEYLDIWYRSGQS